MKRRKEHSEKDKQQTKEDGTPTGKKHARAKPSEKDEKPPRHSAKAEGNRNKREAELKDQLLRLRADFDNFRKRAIRERDTIYRQACESVALELLPVLDHLELGLAAAKKHGADKAFMEGYKMVSDQMIDALAKFGLKQVDTDGETLDPNTHEAVAHLPSDSYPEGTIIAEVRKGFLFGDKLLRAAQVTVSSGVAAAGNDDIDDQHQERG